MIKLLKKLVSRAGAAKTEIVQDKLYSVIVCSVDDKRFNQLTECLARAFGPHPYEIVRIFDARSMCQGYNLGIQRTQGARLIFCHDDIEVLNHDFVDRFDANFARYDVFGPVGTTRLINGNWSAAGRPHVHGSVVHPEADDARQLLLVMFSLDRAPVPNAHALDGMFIGAWRHVAQSLRWDETNLTGFHLYDIDFSFRAHLAGLRVGVANDILLLHQSRGNYKEDWEQAFLDFNARQKTHLSEAKASGLGGFQGLCPDKHVAYECFCQQMAAQDRRNDRT